MDTEKIIIGLVFLGTGLLFFFNNKNIARGTSALYQKLYTEKNLTVMFKVMGGILILGGLALLFLK